MPSMSFSARWLCRLALAATCTALLPAQAQTAPATAPASWPALPPATGTEAASAPKRARLSVPAVQRHAAPATDAKSAPAPSRPVREGERNALKWFNLLDANGDGRISLDEANWAFALRPSLRAQFEAADSNQDGQVTADEVRAAAQRQRVARESRRASERAAQPPTMQAPAEARP